MNNIIDIQEIRLAASEGDVSAMYAMANFYDKEDTREPDIIFKDMVEDAEKGNLFCMFYVSKQYECGDIVRESKDKQIYWLNKIAESEIAKAMYCYFDDEDFEACSPAEKRSIEKVIDSISIDIVYIVRNLIGAACFELAQCYRKSVNIDELDYAQQCLDGALVCKYPPYPGPYVVYDMIIELERQKEFVIEHKNYWPNPELLQSDPMKDAVIVKKIREEIINNVGSDNWNKFTSETKRCFMTAMTCLFYLSRLEKATREYMDFSAVVLPMMKSLEHELRIRFCDKYIEYLKREYPTLEDFTTANNIYKKPGGVRKDKKALFIKDEISGDTIYADGSIAYEQFSLGSFKYTLSKVDRDIEELEKAIELDHTAIEFCNQSLFKNYISDEDTREWLTKLICEVETLIKRRNDSAHGGNVLDEMSAQSTWRDLITIQKVLVSLVERCQ